MTPRAWFALALLFGSASTLPCASLDHSPRFTNNISVVVPPISTDKSVRYDYDIVYVRALRAGNEKHKRFYTDFSQPVTMEPGADLMLLLPDGREELLVRGGEGSITDPMVSFDGQLFVSVKDKEGNVSRVERTFRVQAASLRAAQ